uniref:Pecanex-like protein n=1 Tax=Steinernema glaseri TaxID=37863 RepID=A0A1I7Y2I0_9BILA
MSKHFSVFLPGLALATLMDITSASQAFLRETVPIYISFFTAVLVGGKYNQCEHDYSTLLGMILTVFFPHSKRIFYWSSAIAMVLKVHLGKEIADVGPIAGRFQKYVDALILFIYICRYLTDWQQTEARTRRSTLFHWIDRIRCVYFTWIK